MTFVGFIGPDEKIALDHPAAFRAFKRRLVGEEVELSLRKRRTKRSDKQNRAFHACITPWSKDEGYPMDDLKRDLLIEVFGSREVVSPITGAVVLVPAKPHTSQLTTQEFALLMERTVEIAAECGVQLELPDEYKTRKAQEAKRGRRAA
jgi:hypothetical protein